MTTFRRSTWLALAAIIAIPATVAVAKNYGHGGWRDMSPEVQSRLQDGKIAMAKTALKLTPEQEPLWAAVEQQVRAANEDRQKNREEWRKEREQRKADRKADRGERGSKSRGDMAAMFEKRSTRLAQRAARAKSFSEAFSPFYASLTDVQKDTLRPLMRSLAPKMGRGGHKGRRHADRGMRGHHGKHGHRGWRKGRGDGGEQMQRSDDDRGAADDAGQDDDAVDTDADTEAGTSTE